MFLTDWLWAALSYIGFYRKHAKILFLGLDNAGKTTLLGVLKDDALKVHAPTYNPNMEELIVGTVKFVAYDLGGHAQARKLWRDYMVSVDGIVFVIDASDGERLDEAKLELDGLLYGADAPCVPVLVLCNKIDVASALSERRLRYDLDIHEDPRMASTSNAAGRVCQLFMCSVVRRQGYREGFQWLSGKLR